ncbi:MAG: hypothetical protein V3U88_11480 [Methylococcales bacterium]
MKQFTLFLVSLLSGSAFAATDAFSVLDINSDNSLSKEEASSLPGLLENWRALDVNSDDYLSNTEFEAYARSSRGTATPDTGFNNLN